MAATNGIWLCQSCAKLIDSDLAKYTKEVLLDWKETAEHLAAAEVQGTAAVVRGTKESIGHRRTVFRLERSSRAHSPLLRSVV